MPQLPSHSRNSRIYFINLTNLASVLDVGEPVLEWGWDGRGLTGWIITGLEPEDTPNTPVNNVTQRILRQKLFSFRDIKNAFLSSIPDEKFRSAYMWYDEINAYVDLNTEEGL